MPTFDDYKSLQNLETLRSVAERHRIVHVVRPILLHGRAPDRKHPCRCCNSRKARIVEERPHLEVLFDIVTGTRRVRRPHNAEAFDAFVANNATIIKRIFLPCRAYADQLKPITDRKHKIKAVFGGNQSGKTEVGVAAMVDEWLENGGRGADFWWVAPMREKARDPGLKKLVLGEFSDRQVRPAIPPELIRYYPPNVQSPKQYVLLVDGSKIHLKYASRNGGHLKGSAAKFIVLDEGTEVAHEINWTILVNRLNVTGGRILVCTTPVAGHWLLGVKQRAINYADADAGIECPIVTIELSLFGNPWIDEKDAEDSVEALGGEDDPRVQREIFGRWVGDGNTLWRHFSRDKHLFEGASRDPEYYGLCDITPLAVRSIFGVKAQRTDWICGWDVNDFPQSVLFAKVVCEPDADQSDRKNWKLWVRDSYVRRATVYDLADFLAERGGYLIGEKGGVGNLCIVCDANACYPSARINRKNESADRTVLESRGMLCKPAAYNQHNKPENPTIRNRVNNLHQLMYERRLLIHGSNAKLLEALEGQVADAEGNPVKESNTASDRMSGPADALGYLAWAIFGKAQKAQVSW